MNQHHRPDEPDHGNEGFFQTRAGRDRLFGTITEQINLLDRWQELTRAHGPDVIRLYAVDDIEQVRELPDGGVKGIAIVKVSIKTQHPWDVQRTTDLSETWACRFTIGGDEKVQSLSYSEEYGEIYRERARILENAPASLQPRVPA